MTGNALQLKDRGSIFQKCDHRGQERCSKWRKSRCQQIAIWQRLSRICPLFVAELWLFRELNTIHDKCIELTVSLVGASNICEHFQSQVGGNLLNISLLQWECEMNENCSRRIFLVFYFNCGDYECVWMQETVVEMKILVEGILISLKKIATACAMSVTVLLFKSQICTHIFGQTSHAPAWLTLFFLLELYVWVDLFQHWWGRNGIQFDWQFIFQLLPGQLRHHPQPCSCQPRKQEKDWSPTLSLPSHLKCDLNLGSKITRSSFVERSTRLAAEQLRADALSQGEPSHAK